MEKFQIQMSRGSWKNLEVWDKAEWTQKMLIEEVGASSHNDFVRLLLYHKNFRDSSVLVQEI